MTGQDEAVEAPAVAGGAEVAKVRNWKSASHSELCECLITFTDFFYFRSLINLASTRLRAKSRISACFTHWAKSSTTSVSYSSSVDHTPAKMLIDQASGIQEKTRRIKNISPLSERYRMKMLCQRICRVTNDANHSYTWRSVRRSVDL